MPNWCGQSLTLTGAAADVECVVAELRQFPKEPFVPAEEESSTDVSQRHPQINPAGPTVAVSATWRTRRLQRGAVATPSRTVLDQDERAAIWDFSLAAAVPYRDARCDAVRQSVVESAYREAAGVAVAGPAGADGRLPTSARSRPWLLHAVLPFVGADDHVRVRATFHSKWRPVWDLHEMRSDLYHKKPEGRYTLDPDFTASNNEMSRTLGRSRRADLRRFDGDGVACGLFKVSERHVAVEFLYRWAEQGEGICGLSRYRAGLVCEEEHRGIVEEDDYGEWADEISRSG